MCIDGITKKKTEPEVRIGRESGNKHSLLDALEYICLFPQKKRHTHVAQDESALTPTPMTFVMERGKVGGALTQLVLDLRQVMEPFTASKLRVCLPSCPVRTAPWMSYTTNCFLYCPWAFCASCKQETTAYRKLTDRKLMDKLA